MFTKKNTKSLILSIKNCKKISYKNANYKKMQQKKLQSTNYFKCKNNITIKLKDIQNNIFSLCKNICN